MSQGIVGTGLVPASARAPRILSTSATRLTVDAMTTAVPPVYAVLLSGALTTISAASQLEIRFTAGVRHIGAFLGNVAPNFRFRLNGVLIAPGGGITTNETRSQIRPVAYSVRVAVAAGVQAVDVEWAGFALGVNTLIIDVATMPDLSHAQLVLSEVVP